MRILLVVFSAFQIHAVPAAPNILLESHAGDRHAFFVVAEDKGKPVMRFSNNDGVNRVVVLRPGDLQLLEKKLKELPKKSNDISLCPDSFLSVNSKYGKRSACMGGKLPINKKMSAMTRALASLL